jgi:hypothetical protein
VPADGQAVEDNTLAYFFPVLAGCNAVARDLLGTRPARAFPTATSRLTAIRSQPALSLDFLSAMVDNASLQDN